jgi:AraC family transcriptional regulator, transcriptional activator of pobA
MEHNELQFHITKSKAEIIATPKQFSLYTILFIEKGDGIYHADFNKFSFEGPVMLFSTPFQQIFIEAGQGLDMVMLQFHGDFYCIEYHRAEVSCNGLLFNNSYIKPAVNLSEKDCLLFKNLLNDLEQELTAPQTNDTVIRAYLQLWLAKASAIKINALENQEVKDVDRLMEQFRLMIDQHFLSLHKPSDYAQLLNISSNLLTKRSTKYFNKTPSHLISEKLILEAKRQLHLTRLSIKEIAYRLNFQDEFYFSRVFKKFTKVSPQTFRDKTGISIVADLPADKY